MKRAFVLIFGLFALVVGLHAANGEELLGRTKSDLPDEVAGARGEPQSMPIDNSSWSEWQTEPTLRYFSLRTRCESKLLSVQVRFNAPNSAVSLYWQEGKRVMVEIKKPHGYHRFRQSGETADSQLPVKSCIKPLELTIDGSFQIGDGFEKLYFGYQNGVFVSKQLKVRTPGTLDAVATAIINELNGVDVTPQPQQTPQPPPTQTPDTRPIAPSAGSAGPQNRSLPPFSPPSQTRAMPPDLASVAGYDERTITWGPWVQDPRYPGIAARSSCGPYSSGAQGHFLYVEFENNYQGTIHLEYKLPNNGQSGQDLQYRQLAWTFTAIPTCQNVEMNVSATMPR